MKKINLINFLAGLFLMVCLLPSCSSQSNTINKEKTATRTESEKGGELTAEEFNQRLKEMPDAQVVDVRTPEEFKSGYVAKAMNLDWNGDKFKEHMNQLDKTKPVLVYCLSGGRSASAADEMRKAGFTEVYDMKGGTMAWKKAGLPVEGNKMGAAATGMSDSEYKQLLQLDKLLLVDFNAPWCAPCRKMAPMLEELKISEAERMELKMINADENKMLAESQKVTVLPTLILYKNGKQVWRHEGYIGKEELLTEINKY